jgi:very-short-patch-repair endonuclease
MPKGVYKRTAWHRAILRKNMLVEFSDILKQSIPGLRCDDFVIRVGRHFCCPDIVNHETRKIVEVDGQYWHDKEKDKIRDARLEGAGWKVLRLPADRIHLFEPHSIQKALAFLQA